MTGDGSKSGVVLCSIRLGLVHALCCCFSFAIAVIVLMSFRIEHTPGGAEFWFELDGEDLRRDPLAARKATLASLLARTAPGLRFTEHMDEEDG
jgi:hypothetical protein